MHVTALVCMQCGGPLAAVTTIPTVVECAFCGAAIAVEHERTVVTRPGSSDDARAALIRSANERFFEDLSTLLQSGTPPYDALCTAASRHLGTAGQTDGVARCTIALARDFEAANPGVKVIGDPIVLARIARAYLAAVVELRDRPQYEINLPFLTATRNGPVHFTRVATPAVLAELARR
jgi:hypothetical protein